MKKFFTPFAFVIFFSLLFLQSYSQIPNCNGTVPVFNIDFTGITSDSLWISPLVVKNGQCCSAVIPERCVEFAVTTDANTIGVIFDFFSGGIPPGALFYQLDCGPLMSFSPSSNYTIPIPNPGIHYLTFCKPGNNSNEYRITAITILDTTHVMGNVFSDLNSNCSFDGGEPVLSLMPVNLIHNNAIVQTVVTNPSGNYFFNAPAGTDSVQITAAQAASRGYSLSCPPSGIINIPSLPSLNNDFGLSCTLGFDLVMNIGVHGFRPGFMGTFYPFVGNSHCIPVSGQAKLYVGDPNLTYINSLTPPDAINSDTLIWNFTNLSNTAPGFNIGWVDVMVNPVALLGDSIRYYYTVEPIAGDAYPQNNSASRSKVISNSFDPNEKNVEPQGLGAQGFVPANTLFTYTIQFQNTGNDTAYDIFIADPISSNLDMATFLPIAASHPYYVSYLSPHYVKFSFYSIMLADSGTNESLSHGWITYQIQTKPGLAPGTQIQNTAEIYFDFNAAIHTDTTLNTIVIPTSVSGTKLQDNIVSIFPNPATNQLTIVSKQRVIESIEIYDVLGQKMYWEYRSLAPKHQTIIDVSEWSAGVYFARVRGENSEIVNQKIVIQK